MLPSHVKDECKKLSESESKSFKVGQVDPNALDRLVRELSTEVGGIFSYSYDTGLKTLSVRKDS